MNIVNRVMQIDLDVMCYGDGDGYDYDDLNSYIRERLEGSGANVVYVQVSTEDFANIASDRNRMADYLLFDPGHSLEANVMNANIFKVGVQIIRDILPDSRIFAWAPSLYSAFLMKENTVVKATEEAERDSALWYRRASPFSTLTHSRLSAFFEALGQSSEMLDGVMFQDDLLLSNWEDVSEEGIELLVARYGLTQTDDASLHEFLSDDENEQNQDWRRYKTYVLDELSQEMFQAFRRGYQQAFPELFTAREKQDNTRLLCARNYYDGAVLYRDDFTGEWYAQNLDTALDLYDHVVIMSYYNMSERGDPASQDALAWLQNLANIAIAIANSNGRQRSDRLLFKLQSVCWGYFPDGDDYTIPAEVLQKQIKALTDVGVKGVGFYPALQGRARFDMAAL